MIKLLQYYRVISAFLIVLIHQAFWKTGPVFGGFKDAAVPLFAAISGYLFYSSEKVDVISTLAKKAQRILIPFVIWSVVYCVMNCVVLDVYLRHGPLILPSIGSWLTGGVACHLWFLPSLFVAFVASAFCKGFASLVVLFALGVATQFIPNYASDAFLGYVRLYFGRLLVFFMLGGLLAHLKLSNRTALIVGLVMTILGVANICHPVLSGLAWQPLPLIVGLIVLAPIVRPPELAFVNSLAKSTMGIYLVHVLFTSAANIVLTRGGGVAWYLGFPVSVAIFAASYLFVRFTPKWLY